MNLLDQAEALSRQGRLNEAVALVANGARQGDAEALFTMANWRLWGQFGPRDLAMAHQLLRAAAETGHVEARLMRATLLANGTGVPADWAGAIALLRDLAPANATAARQLRLIDAMALMPDGSPAGRRSAAERISDRPCVDRVPGLLSAEECTYLMVLAGPRLQPSMVVDPRGNRIPHPVRTSDGTSFGPPQEDPVVRAINLRLAAASGTDVTQGEPLHMLRYRPGEQYRPHLDAITGEANQRILTVLVYLNDRYQGGETCFTEVKLHVRPKVGDAIIFRNVDENGRPDMHSRHAGLPVSTGVKWLCTRWIRRTPYHPWGLFG